MNKRELKELVALRAIELLSNIIVLHMDDNEKIPQKMLEDLKAAAKLWSPSVAELQQVRDRLLPKVNL